MKFLRSFNFYILNVNFFAVINSVASNRSWSCNLRYLFDYTCRNVNLETVEVLARVTVCLAL